MITLPGMTIKCMKKKPYRLVATSAQVISSNEKGNELPVFLEIYFLYPRESKREIMKNKKEKHLSQQPKRD